MGHDGSVVSLQQPALVIQLELGNNAKDNKFTFLTQILIYLGSFLTIVQTLKKGIFYILVTKCNVDVNMDFICFNATPKAYRGI